MTSEMRERIKEIVDRASQLPVDERRRYVEEAAAGDEALMTEALRILEALDANPGFMSAPTVGSQTVTHMATPLAEGPGTRIGAYKLLQKIGEGGFGTVFMAEQTEPVTRRVALKIIKLGMDTRQVIARFEQERQALAMMDHPHIARVLDAGATATGRPFFVMELCTGQSITQYADSNKLSIHDRLELLVQVCHAVQHAHQKGVIHHDIKPSNVLVHTQDGRPQAKVIDFGIAKATAARLTEKTLFTEHGQFIGTPQYMSPEQAAGSLDVDTRSDVYSLGVLLYELLTGVTPFDPKSLRSGAYDEIVRMIREVEPPKPSTRLSGSTDTLPSVAAARSIEPRKLGSLIRGDLDWIVMKALDKDRARRYETPNGLAADILQHLAGASVVAAPPSATYRLRKFVRRNRALVGAIGSIAVVLLLAIIGMSLLTGWALRERDRAEDESHNARLAEAEQRRLAKAEERARKKAEAINQFVTRALVSSDPHQCGSRDFLVTDAMDQAIKLSDQPETEAALRITISEILNGNARSDGALRLAERALAINQDLHPGDHPDVATGLSSVADCLVSLGRPAEALPKLEAALAMRQRLFPGDSPAVAAGLTNLAHCLQALGRWNEVLPRLEAAQAMFQRPYPGDHPLAAAGFNNVGACLQDLGRPSEALLKFESALAMRQRLSPTDDPETARTLNNIAFCLHALGRAADALPKFEAALEMYQRLFPGDHPDVADSLNNVGYCQHSLGHSAEGLPDLQAGLEMRQRLFPGDHADVAASLNTVAVCLQAMGQWNEALPKLEAALEMRRRLFPGDHPHVAGALTDVATCLQSLGRSAEAVPKLEEALQMYQRLFPGDHPQVALTLGVLGHCLKTLGRLEEALRRYETALEMYRRLYPSDHPDVAAGLGNVADCLRSLGRPSEALPDYEAALEMRQRLYHGDRPELATSLNNVAICLEALGRPADAVPKYEAAMKMYRRVLPAGHPYAYYPQVGCARALITLGQYAEAEPLLGDVAEQCERSQTHRRMLWPTVLAQSVRLYDAWHAAAPDQGYDAKAAELRGKLEAWQATTQPSSQRSPRGHE